VSLSLHVDLIDGDSMVLVSSVPWTHVGGWNTVLVDALSRRTPLVIDTPTVIFGADVIHPHPGEETIAVVKMRPLCTEIPVTQLPLFSQRRLNIKFL
jgi:hypothetical protein